MLHFRTTLYLVLVIFSLVPGRFGAKEPQSMGLGDKCDVRVPYCNATTKIRCINYVCACDFGRTLNKEKKECVLTIGGSCSLLEGNNKVPETDKCPGTSFCETKLYWGSYTLPKSMLQQIASVSSVCACPEGYAPDATKLACIAVAQYGKPCSPPGKKGTKPLCDPKGNFVCGAEGTCECQRKGMYYDKRIAMCAFRLGAKCKLGDQCEDDTVCSHLVTYWSLTLKFNKLSTTGNYASSSQEKTKLMIAMADLRNSDGECACAPGFVANSKGKCVGSYQSHCGKELECHTEGFLTCVDSICQCDQGMSQVFEGNRCYLSVGSACAEKKGPQCHGNATCTDGHCECPKGLVSTADRRCLATFGSPCNNSKAQLCNSDRGLGCHNGECACFDSSLTWNKKTKACETKKDGRCGHLFIGVFGDALRGKADHQRNPLDVIGSTGGVQKYVVACPTGTRCTADDAFYRYCKNTE